MYSMILFVIVVAYVAVWRLHRLTGVGRVCQNGRYADEIEFKTGDLLVHSSHSLDGRLLQAWADEPFTHIALLLVEDSDVYVFNCDVQQDECPCVIQNEVRAGPQLQMLKHKMQGASGLLYHVPLTGSANEKLTRRYAAQYCNWSIGFRTNVLALFHAAAPQVMPQIVTGGDEMFCTEFVAHVIAELSDGVIQIKRQATPLYQLRALHALGVHDVTKMTCIRSRG
jgi:hypothetical protein